MEYKFKTTKSSSLSNSTDCSNANQSVVQQCFNETRIFETVQIDHSFNFSSFIGDKHCALQTMDHLDSDDNSSQSESDESDISFQTVN